MKILGKLVIVSALLLCTITRAEPTEAEIKRLIKAGNPQAIELFFHYQVGGGNQNNDKIAVRPEKLVAFALEGKHSMMYGPIIAWWQQKRDSMTKTQRQQMLHLLSNHIENDNAFADHFLSTDQVPVAHRTGDQAARYEGIALSAHGRRMTAFSYNTLTDRKQPDHLDLKLVAKQNSGGLQAADLFDPRTEVLTIANALNQNGALKRNGITTVTFGPNDNLPLSEVELDPFKFSQWVLRTGQSALFKSVLELRNRMQEQLFTNPEGEYRSKLEKAEDIKLAAEIDVMIDKLIADPSQPQGPAMLKALKDHLVRKHLEWGQSDFASPIDNKTQYSTLFLNPKDPKSIEWARRLEANHLMGDVRQVFFRDSKNIPAMPIDPNWRLGDNRPDLSRSASELGLLFKPGALEREGARLKPFDDYKGLKLILSDAGMIPQHDPKTGQITGYRPAAFLTRTGGHPTLDWHMPIRDIRQYDESAREVADSAKRGCNLEALR